MPIKGLCFVVIFIVLTGCGQSLSEEIEKVDESIISVLSQKQSFLSFSWIEQGFNGVFAPINKKLGQSERELIEKLGRPVSEGNYEGGTFLQYKDITYFFNPDTKKNVAIVIDIKREQLTDEELKRKLGTPDQSEFNEMDGVWMYVYELDEYELIFEASSEHSVLTHAWLKEKIK
ncbi:DUF4309 domain-containing protein [Alkalihalobacillus deserti]|uniref:DUF4309 domain-containing protein n=1 Tax=Alkalihalobacillus deserti TaxID=2879466 RepID=UPI001D1398F2|nr:DUF4309 domain-containing protein [Alkalihalobacillus deserti]